MPRLLLAMALLVGCAKSAMPMKAPMEPASYAPPPPPPPAPLLSEAEPAPEPSAPASARKVHYSGYAHLRATDPEDTLDAVVAIAEEAGGRVEKLASSSVTVRVPVASFDAVFAEITELGDLVDRSISAVDVTEAFAALDLRLQTARASRDRLTALLARATDELEKLALLSEIQRLTLQIDEMDSRIRTLQSLAELSRITVEVQPRQQQARRDATLPAGFGWMAALSPFRKDVALSHEALWLDVPEGMVGLGDDEHFVAESADGASVWAHTQPNDPEGDGAFWAEALDEHLSGDFSDAERWTAGDFELIALTDHGEDPYTWWVGVRADGKHRDVVEAWFPSADHLERHEAAVRACIEGGGR